mmetsp:Transcript_9368/g.10365  ORF Transcript_9368/g.10365 Transcript_9368/m.10365 type:complete len:217 (-) Transcript_9368:28-678(-)
MWPLLSKQAATTTRFDWNLNKQGKWIKYRGLKYRRKRYCKIELEHWAHGIREGPCKYWYRNGLIRTECSYVNGRPEAVYKLLALSGQQKSQSNYVNGKQEGEYKKWHRNGILAEQCHYVNNKQEGEFKSWYDNGRKAIHCYFVDGKKHGEYQNWFTFGPMRERMSFVNGEKKGEHTFYFHNRSNPQPKVLVRRTYFANNNKIIRQTYEWQEVQQEE